MAFSVGALLAATLMVRNSQRSINPPFRCAVFLCGGIPGDPSALAQNDIRLLNYAADGEIISVPTAHIWGKNDPQVSFFGPELSRLSNSRLKSIFIHEGGHEVPSAKDRPALMRAVNCIQTTIEKVHTFH